MAPSTRVAHGCEDIPLDLLLYLSVSLEHHHPHHQSSIDTYVLVGFLFFCCAAAVVALIIFVVHVWFLFPARPTTRRGTDVAVYRHTYIWYAIRAARFVFLKRKEPLLV